MTPRPCIESGCPAYAIPKRARCQVHDLARRRDGTLTGARGTSREWAKARKLAWTRGRGLCAACGEPADAVHHKDENPFNHGQDNLELRCDSCHREVH